MDLRQFFNWTIVSAQSWLQQLSGVFETQLFSFGGKQFSVGSVVELVTQAIIVLAIAALSRRILKQRVFLQLGLDVGTRDSLSAIVSYTLTVIGFFIIVEANGINLSSLTVFAGAVGIGFGIGLQNLTSNFISGITLLFGQSVKVGDYVEVDQLAGTIEEISIRTATLRTADGIFVVVPNSRFLDSSIVNWSYRDPKCRITVPFTVIEGSDSLTVMEALLAAARSEARVLASPSPEVYFKGIEGSVLRFDLLVWIQTPIETDSIKSALQFLVEAEFRDRQVETKSAPTNVVFDDLPVLLRQWRSLTTGEVEPQPSESVKPISGWMLRDLLKTVSCFQNCSEIELRQIIEKGYRKKLTAGTTIARENDPGDSFYIILSGAVEVFVESINQQIAIRRTGEFIGEMSLLLGIPRSATLRTVEDSILFVVDHDNLENLLKQHSELADQIAAELAQRQEALKSLGIALTDSAKEETPFDQVRKRIQAIFSI